MYPGSLHLHGSGLYRAGHHLRIKSTILFIKLLQFLSFANIVYIFVNISGESQCCHRRHGNYF